MTFTIALSEGADGYAGTLDTFVDEARSDTMFGLGLSVLNDTSSVQGGAQIGLVRFAVFAAAGGPVPDSAEITAATLELNVSNTGQRLDIHDALFDWNESTTWSVSGRPMPDTHYASDPVSSIPDGMVGVTAHDVSASATRWQTEPNRGWVFVPSGGNSVIFDSSEGTMPPKLTLTYVD